MGPGDKKGKGIGTGEAGEVGSPTGNFLPGVLYPTHQAQETGPGRRRGRRRKPHLCSEMRTMTSSARTKLQGSCQ